MFSSLFSLCLITGMTLYVSSLVKRRRYPPGPTPLPLLGNALELDISQPWLSYLKFGKKYNSPVVCASALGMNMISINDYEVARDILGKRGYRNAGRPPLEMLDKVVGAIWSWVALPASHPIWKYCRKEADIMLRPSESGSKAFRGLEMEKMKDVLEMLKNQPEEFVHHCRYFTLAFNMELAYGVVITDSHDPFIAIADQAFEAVNQSSLYPIVNAFPWLRHLPSWLPFMQFKKESVQWRQANRDLAYLPLNSVLETFEKDPDGESVAKQMLRRKRDGEDIDMEMIRYMLWTLVGAGSDTSTSVVLSFILCMKIFPGIQTKAQEEVDRVVGKSRMPTFADRDNLPYVEAVMYEVLRVAAVVPFGIPHAATADDIWRDESNGKEFLIPKDSVLFANAWAMTRDPKLYANPMRFTPSRFLNEDGSFNRDAILPDMVYGFRPRTCPGKYVVEDLLFIFAASVLSQFDIRPKGGEKSTLELEGMELDSLWKSGLIRYPKEFECEFIPRIV
ncbi:cytochrome P450 [Flagelloscypha sp. PMI_526]|nr:cytochrome P450 [Flagelloscypha sp. PMI_526]